MNKALLLALFCAASFSVLAQKAPENWQNLDYRKDKVHGISTEKAYKELLKNKPGLPVIVAVIDGGTDFNHEDLKGHIWFNKGEIDNNHLDDDADGYVDDFSGWNFIGGPDSSVVLDTYEFTRQYAALKKKLEPEDGMPAALPKSDSIMKLFHKLELMQMNKVESFKRQQGLFDSIRMGMNKIYKSAGTMNPSVNQIKAFEPTNRGEKIAQGFSIKVALTGGTDKSPYMDNLREAEESIQNSLNYQLNTAYNSRLIVQDRADDVNEHFYGNAKVTGPHGDHGTHVAGIIAADRANEKGIKGVCDVAQILILRVVPDGDERDKDVANSIRYAVDHGAKVINMSFGKDFSPNKDVVDAAVKYAQSKDVLLVHAAGNDGRNTDDASNFPNPIFVRGGYVAPNWIEVGASSWEKKKNLVASFSNYGVNVVDLMAPGVDINSTLPENKYGSMSGTSMASPVVAGMAALIRSRYPMLTAVQVKECIMKSVVTVRRKVYIPGTDHKKARFKTLSRTGGIANIYNALVLAEKISKTSK